MKLFDYLIIFLFSTMSYGATMTKICDGTTRNPCIVQDTDQTTDQLKNYRTSAMISKSYSGDVSGLENLWFSGGAAFSKQDWENLFQKIKAQTENRANTIIDLDLRQESHGYVNGNAFNLTATNNWMNLNKNLRQVAILERNWLHSLKNLSDIKNVLTPQQFKSQQFSSGITIPIQSVESENAIVSRIGFKYVRLAVTDHMAPRDSEVDRFITIVKKMQPNTWLHIHCRGGDGRTTTFMAMYDMLNNANKVAFKDIVKRQAAVTPDYDLSKVNRKNPRLTLHYKKRLDFLNNFYLFSLDYLNGYTGSWSTWVKNKKTPY